MSVIDKVSVGGTTYDVQDTVAQAMANAVSTIVSGELGLESFGGVSASLSLNGVKYTRKGNRVTISGTRSGTTHSYINMTRDNGLTYDGNSGTSGILNNQAFTNTKARVYQGRTYQITASVLSGTYTRTDTTKIDQLCLFLYKPSTSTGAYLAICDDLYTALITNEQKRFTLTWSPSGDATIGFGFLSRQGVTFGDLVVEFSIQDITDADAIIITGATPTIAAGSGARYVCSASYVTSLSFTPSSSGICSVRFVSGTTPTVLTLPNTVVMPDWWTGVEANRTYEISIEDGVYGAVTSWA